MCEGRPQLYAKMILIAFWGKLVPGLKATFVSLAALVALGFFFCDALAAQTAPPLAPAPVPMHDVTDETGRTVRIPVTPTRIVSLAPSLTETVYALGAEDRLVGDTVYCDYPPDAQKKPKVGGVIDPNLEAIAALHPDLVLVSKDGGNRLETVRALETLAIPAYATDTHKITEILTSTEKLADILNIPEAGKVVADDMQKHLAALAAKLNGLPPRRVLFVVWTEPLISIGKGTFVADAISKAGAVSVVDSAQDWPQVSMEEVAHLQPDYLVFAPSHTDAPQQDFNAFADLPGWRILNAVRERHYAIISDAVIRPAPRIMSAIEELARQLHPEAFLEQPHEKAAPPANNSVSLVAFQPKPAPICSSESADILESACAR
jgi:iron complex transport system substrate-binding protein